MKNPAVYPNELAPQGAGNDTPIYPARLRLGDNSTIKFQCTYSAL